MTPTKSRRKPRQRTAKRVDRPLADGESPDSQPLPAFTKTSLDGEVKNFIVILLAKDQTPQQVVEAVKDVYSLEVTRQLVRTYNPDQCAQVAPKWVELFNDTRKKFRDDINSVAISHKSVRLQSCDRVRVTAERQGNHAMVLAACKQAAEEVGELYTNRHKMELTGKDGGAIEVKTDDLRKRIVGRIAGVASRIAPHTNNLGVVAGGARGS
jgi:hypothetical protein